MLLEIGEVNELKGRFMSGFQHDAWRTISLEGFLPASGTQAPLVARLETGKAEIRPRGGEIIAALFRELEEIRSHFRADDVDALIASAAAAATIAVPAGERIRRAGLEVAAEHIMVCDCHGMSLDAEARFSNYRVWLKVMDL